MLYSDITFGVHDVEIKANIVTRQVGPLLSNGSSEYLYLGCYNDGMGRQLQKSFNSPTNENAQCQDICFKAGYPFAGTEYHTECWCGNNPPSVARYSLESAKDCSFSCPGDITQACGGSGTFISIFYDRTKYVPGAEALPLGSALTSLSSRVPASFSTPTSILSTASLSSTPAMSSPTSSKPTAAQAGPTNVQRLGSYSYVGCYTEATKKRALGERSLATDLMTVGSCYEFCGDYTWFGLEYHRECKLTPK
jgi:iron transport multicopper oxidase